MSVQACAELVAKGDPDRLRAIMAGPVAARQVQFPIFAMCLEVAKAPWVTKEAMIAEMRLQWWRDVLEEIAEGREVRRHEVSTPLAGALDAEAARALDCTVTARQWDIYRDPHADEAAFAAYINATAAEPVWQAARLLGAEAQSEADIKSMAQAAGLARYFAAIPALEEAGRVPLIDGRPEAIAALATEALTKIRAAKPTFRRLPKTAQAALYDVILQAPLLKQIAEHPMSILDGGLGIPDGQKTLRLLFKKFP